VNVTTLTAKKQGPLGAYFDYSHSCWPGQDHRALWRPFWANFTVGSWKKAVWYP